MHLQAGRKFVTKAPSNAQFRTGNLYEISGEVKFNEVTIPCDGSLKTFGLDISVSWANIIDSAP